MPSMVMACAYNLIEEINFLRGFEREENLVSD